MPVFAILHAEEIVDGDAYIVHANHLIDNFNAIIEDFSDRLSLSTGSAQTIASALTLTGALTANGGISLASSFSLTAAGTVNLSLANDPGSPANGMIWYNSTTNLFKARINGATAQLATTTYVPASSKGALWGLTLSNNGTTPNTDIDIAAGQCVDDTGSDLMVYAGGTKRLSSAWAVGSGFGASDTGTIPTSGTLHIFIIKRVDTGVVDAFCSTSLNPTLPASYTLKRRIGSLITDSSAHMIGFVQHGDEFLVKDPVMDINATDTSTAATRTLTVPTGVTVKALLNAFIASTNPAATYISSLDVNDDAPSTTATIIPNVGSDTGTGTRSISVQVQVWTNTSGQVRTRSAASTTLRISTMGWVDNRGRVA